MTSSYLQSNSGAAEHMATGAGTMVRGLGSGGGLTGLSIWLPATVHSGIYDASSRDRGVPTQVQCPEKTEGESSLPGRAASILKSYLSAVHPLPHHRRKLPSWLELSYEGCTHWEPLASSCPLPENRLCFSRA